MDFYKECFSKCAVSLVKVSYGCLSLCESLEKLIPTPGIKNVVQETVTETVAPFDHVAIFALFMCVTIVGGFIWACVSGSGEEPPKPKPSMKTVMDGTEYKLAENSQKLDLPNLADILVTSYNANNMVRDYELFKNLAIGVAQCRDQQILDAVNYRINLASVFSFHPEKELLPALLEDDQNIIYEHCLTADVKKNDTFFPLLMYLVKKQRYNLAAQLMYYTRDSWSSYEKEKIAICKEKHSNETIQALVALSKKFNVNFIRNYPLKFDAEINNSNETTST
jgi:hypothetical protein